MRRVSLAPSPSLGKLSKSKKDFHRSSRRCLQPLWPQSVCVARSVRPNDYGDVLNDVNDVLAVLPTRMINQLRFRAVLLSPPGAPSLPDLAVSKFALSADISDDGIYVRKAPRRNRRYQRAARTQASHDN